jgi:hypothetical protein
VRRTNPELLEGGGTAKVSCQNLAFYQSHEDEVHKIMQAGRAQMRR